MKRCLESTCQRHETRRIHESGAAEDTLTNRVEHLRRSSSLLLPMRAKGMYQMQSKTPRVQDTCCAELDLIVQWTFSIDFRCGDCISHLPMTAASQRRNKFVPHHFTCTIYFLDTEHGSGGSSFSDKKLFLMLTSLASAAEHRSKGEQTLQTRDGRSITCDGITMYQSSP